MISLPSPSDKYDPRNEAEARRSIEQALASLASSMPDKSGPSVGGSGTTGKIPMWTGAATLGDSTIIVDQIAYLDDLFTQAMADARYSLLGHSHTTADITDFAEAGNALWIGVDNFNTLGDARYLQLVGGTLTGALHGTTADFSGEVDGEDFVLVGGAAGGGTAAALFSVLYSGGLIASSVTSMNFVGGGVSVSGTGGDVTVSVTFDQAAADARYALLGHTHTAAQITDFASAVASAGATLWLSLAGGTLTGALHGTTADFSGEVDGEDFVLAGGAGGGGASAALFSVLDEGVLKANNVTSMNFVGAGVVASAAGGDVTVEIVFDAAAAQTAGDARWLKLAGGTLSGALTAPGVTVSGASAQVQFNDRSSGSAHVLYADAGIGRWWTGGIGDAIRVDYAVGHTTIVHHLFTEDTVHIDGNLVRNTTTGFYCDATGTGYAQAALQLRERSLGASTAYEPPRLAFHWGGVVATQMTIEADGTIAVIDNPGTAYAPLKASNLLASGSYFIAGLPVIERAGSYHEFIDPSGSIALHLGGPDPANYYNNTSHIFRSRDGASTFANVSAALFDVLTGMRIQGSGNKLNWFASGYENWYAGTISGSTNFSIGSAALPDILTIQNGGNVTLKGHLYFNYQYGNGLVGAYDPTRYRAIYAMGDSYRMDVDGTTLGDLYGLFFAYDNTAYKNVTGLNLGHGFGLAAGGVQKFYCGELGMWHAGTATATDFILS